MDRELKKRERLWKDYGKCKKAHRYQVSKNQKTKE